MKPSYERMATLICPTCAAKDFEYDEVLSTRLRTYKCLSCGSEFSDEDLVDRNAASVEIELSNLKKEIVSDLEKDLKRKLKKWIK